MKIDFKKVLLDLNGNPLQGESFTVGEACIQALMAPTPSAQGRQENISGTAMVGLYKLAQRIHGATEPMEISPEDVSLLRARVALMYQAAAVVGPIWELLEG